MNYKILRIFFVLSFIGLATLISQKQIPMWWFFMPLVIYNLLLVLGAIFIRMNFYIHSVNSVEEFSAFMPLDANAKNICLTFDDGIHAVNTVRALDILKQFNIKAHFFIIGKNIEGNEAVLQRMQNEGHGIGNHSYTHSWNFDLKSTSAMEGELVRTNDRIKEVSGVTPVIFRPPYGVTNPNLARAIRNTQMISMGWNLRSLDTVAKSTEELLQKLKHKTKPNALVLLHERCDITVDVLTDYIDYCLREGYTFVTLKTPHEV
ncbi:MAG: polysaccharide deacetylase family protein [Chitinophagaceae bacterium]|nr:polysaccharide deacetylase family protein [Chitinophagaceae bacterium]